MILQVVACPLWPVSGHPYGRVMADPAASALQQSALPAPVRPRLSPSQEFRVRVARNDLARLRGRDLSGVPTAELQLETGAFVSSLYNVLQIVEDLAVGEES